MRASSESSGGGGSSQTAPDPGAEAARAVSAGFAAARDLADSAMFGIFGARRGGGPGRWSNVGGRWIYTPVDPGTPEDQTGTGYQYGAPFGPLADAMFRMARAGFAVVESAALGLSGVGSGPGLTADKSELINVLRLVINQGETGSNTMYVINGPNPIELTLSSLNPKHGEYDIKLGPDLFDPNPLRLEASKSAAVKVTVHVDKDSPKGKYTGLILAEKWPDHRLILEVVVR